MHYLYPGFPAYMPCPNCGASIKRGEENQHECDEDRQKKFRFEQELTELGSELEKYLESNEAKFFSWLGKRRLRI